MPNIDNWKYYFKMNPSGSTGSSNLLYVPKINPEQNVMCMSFNPDLEYRNDEPVIQDDLIQWFFEREVKFLNKFSHLKTTPAVYDIDLKNRHVFIEWNKETLSQIAFDPARNLEEKIS